MRREGHLLGRVVSLGVLELEYSEHGTWRWGLLCTSEPDQGEGLYMRWWHRLSMRIALCRGGVWGGDGRLVIYWGLFNKVKQI